MFGLYRVLSIYTIKILDGILKKPILKNIHCICSHFFNLVHCIGNVTNY